MTSSPADRPVGPRERKKAAAQGHANISAGEPMPFFDALVALLEKGSPL
jgi:hypothetical protein